MNIQQENQFQSLALRVELLKEEIRYNPENLDAAAEELIAIFNFQQTLIQAEGE